MKKLIFSILTLLSVTFALTVTSCGGDDGVPEPGPALGTKNNPYNVVEAINAVKGLTWTSNTVYDQTGEVYVKGKISRIAEHGTFTDSGVFSNATFYISYSGGEYNELYCYRVHYLGNFAFVPGQTDIKVGDEVIICGKLMNYQNNTPETVANATYLVSINGATDGGSGGGPSLRGDGTKENPYTPAEACYVVKDLTWTSNTVYDKTGDVYVRGKISRISAGGTYTESGTYGNASFFISEDGTTNDEFFCFRMLYFGNKEFVPGQTDIKVGDEVLICGKLMNYRGNTPETVANEAWLYMLNGATDGGPGTDPTPSGVSGNGTKEDPYNPLGAVNAVKGLTWTSNTVYESTGNVYVKGKISKIHSNGTFTGGGTFGNASFNISEDGTEKDEFLCFRILYFGNKKYEEGQTDIKVGDEVVICGKLMNYKGNTPETVANEAWLYMLNGATDGGSGHPSGGTVAFATNSDAQTWSEATDGTYGKGFVTSNEGLEIGYYQHTCSTSSLVAPNANHVRIYKNAVLSIASTGGKRIKKIVIGCAPDAGTTSYCHDMTGLEGGASAVANKSALTITWTGSASKVVLQSNNAQVRMEKISVQFE